MNKDRLEKEDLEIMEEKILVWRDVCAKCRQLKGITHKTDRVQLLKSRYLARPVET